MGYSIKQSTTAKPLIFRMILAANHIDGATGITPTVTLSKNGGSFASPSGAVSEIGSGWYKVAGNATDSNTLGVLGLHATGAGCDPTDREFEVVAYDPDDAAGLGLSRLDQTVSSVYNRIGAPAGASIAADIAAVMTRLGSPAGASIADDLAAISSAILTGIPKLLYRGLAVSGTGTSLVLQPGVVTFTGRFAGCIAAVVGGAGSGQTAKIMTSDSGTGALGLDESWASSLDGTSVIEIHTAVLRDIDSPLSVINARTIDLFNGLLNNTVVVNSHSGFTVGTTGSSGSVQLNAGASGVDDFYNGWLIEVFDTNGEQFVGFVSGYNGTTKIASIVRSSWAPAFSGTVLFNLSLRSFTARATRDDGSSIPSASDNKAAILPLIQSIARSDATVDPAIGGTFLPSTDSLQAVRDRGDVAWLTGSGGGGSSGAWTVTVTVRDSNTLSPLDAVLVTVKNADESAVIDQKRTNTLGLAVFSLDDATYKVHVSSALGYDSLAAQTLTVNGANLAVTYDLSAQDTEGAYASAAAFIIRYDVRLLGDLASDEDTRIDPGDLATNDRIRACLADATGKIKTSATVANQYLPDDLQVLADANDPFLIRLTCDLALGLLYQARGIGVAQGHREAVDNANAELLLLQQGKSVLNNAAAREAGLPEHGELTASDREVLRRPSDRSIFPGADRRTV